MVCAVGCSPLLNPNPQALTNGATVMSNAPSVSFEISMARLNTSANISSTFTSSLRLTLLMVEVELKGESDWSTFFSSSSISFFRLLSLW